MLFQSEHGVSFTPFGTVRAGVCDEDLAICYCNGTLGRIPAPEGSPPGVSSVPWVMPGNYNIRTCPCVHFRTPDRMQLISRPLLGGATAGLNGVSLVRCAGTPPIRVGRPFQDCYPQRVTSPLCLKGYSSASILLSAYGANYSALRFLLECIYICG